MKKVYVLMLACCVCLGFAACGASEDAGVHYVSCLESDVYYNIATVSKVFSHTPLVTCDEDNPGDVSVRILDDHGQIIGGAKILSPGKTVALEEVPAFSGNCTIQGKTVDTSGAYGFWIR